MPDLHGRLTQEERTKATEFINEKSKIPNDGCLVCGDPDTRVGDNLVATPAGGMGGGLSNTMAQLVVPVVCHNCGFIRYFHAGAMGFVPWLDPPEGGEEK